MSALKNSIKRALRPLADAILASSRTLPDRVENHLTHSPTLTGTVEGLRSQVESAARRAAAGEALQDATLAERLNAHLAQSPALHQAIHDDMMQSQYLSAKLYPNGGRANFYALPAAAPRQPGDEMPLPPDDWLAPWGGRSAFLYGGERDAGFLRRVLAEQGFHFEPGTRVLEFGSSRGRMMRHLQDVAVAGCEIWGVDVEASDVSWCQQHMAPPFRFAANTSAPHLPFEDRTFDLVYAGSVFTHISDLADAWVLELKRVLKPGGRLYASVHDNHSVQIVYDRGAVGTVPFWTTVMGEFERVTGRRPLSDFKIVTVLRGGPSAEQVFYDRDYLLRHWAQYLRIVSVTEEAYSAFQTAILMEK